MTPEEKAHFLEIYHRQQEGYRIMEVMRRKDLRTTDTVKAMECLSDFFDHALLSQPMRESSGLVEFYQALAKSR